MTQPMTDDEMEAMTHTKSQEPKPLSDDEMEQASSPRWTDRLIGPAIVKGILGDKPDDFGSPGYFDAISRNMGTQTPVLGPIGKGLGERFRAAVEPGDYSQNLDKIQKQNASTEAQDYQQHPGAMNVAGALGGMSVPVKPSVMNMTGPGGIAARAGTLGAVASSDTALRGGSLGQSAMSGLAAGGTGAALDLATNMGVANKVFGGVPEEVQQNYVARRPQVKAMIPTSEEDMARNLHSAVDQSRQAASEGSSKSYEMLGQSGYQQPQHVITGALEDAIDKIQSGGAYDSKTHNLIGSLKQMRSNVLNDAVPGDMPAGQYGPAEPGIPAPKVKNFINQYRNTTNAYGQNMPGEPAGTQYNRGILQEADKSIRSDLNQNVPQYEQHMQQLAQKTAPLSDIQDRFSDVTKTSNSMRRMMRGRDPEGLDALKRWDSSNGTDFSQQMLDKETANKLTGDFTRGSRAVNVGKGVGKAAGHIVGGAAGGYLGEGLGGVVGAAQDAYAKNAARFLLDVAQTPGIGTAGAMLRRAAEKGPYAVLGMHKFLYDRMPGYQEQIDAIKGDSGQ